MRVGELKCENYASLVPNERTKRREDLIIICRERIILIFYTSHHAAF